MFNAKLLDYSLKGEVYLPETTEETELWSRFLLESSIAGGDDNIRENITLQLIKAEPSPGKHGWDGQLGRLKIEVKNETQSVSNSSSRLNGTGIFNNVSWKSFKKYQEDKGLYLQGGYTREGRLIYCVAFEMKHILPIIEAKLRSVLPDGIDRDSMDVQVSISAKDYPEEAEVVLFPQNFNHRHFSQNLGELITRNWYNRTQIRSTRLAPLSLS